MTKHECFDVELTEYEDESPISLESEATDRSLPDVHPIQAFVRNPVKISVGVLMVALFGVIALLRMPMQLTPEVQIPTISVQTRWPGASPQEVEREIVREQEEGAIDLNQAFSVEPPEPEQDNAELNEIEVEDVEAGN